jgi:copper(I)-binding protein
MLVELRGQLFEGTMFPMTLVFERAGEVEIEVEVTGGGGNGAHQGAAH